MNQVKLKFRYIFDSVMTARIATNIIIQRHLQHPPTSSSNTGAFALPASGTEAGCSDKVIEIRIRLRLCRAYYPIPFRAPLRRLPHRQALAVGRLQVQHRLEEGSGPVNILLSVVSRRKMRL